jgi:hypothetical protein
MSSPEAQVVRSLKRHLLDRGLAGIIPASILVDADPSYIHSRYARDLEPMARVEVGGGRPDLLCSATRTEGVLVAGFEVKAATRDWVQGLAQARRYRAGVHYSYLALPGRAEHLEREASPMARETGVGILVLSDDVWHEVVKPAEPIPLPWTLGPTTAALEGVPVARQLQLNHPLNYLVVPYLAATLPPGRVLMEELETRWPDLGSQGTRRHAIVGAATLRLIDTDLEPTAEGLAVADLMLALGFRPETRPLKRARLVDASPALAAVARFVLLQQPAVQLVLRVLGEAGRKLDLPRLAHAAILRDPPLGTALFLSDPSIEVRPVLPGTAYNPTTVFKLKQNLWHAGLLATKCHVSAGGKATTYKPAEDAWELEHTRLLGHFAGRP